VPEFFAAIDVTDPVFVNAAQPANQLQQRLAGDQSAFEQNGFDKPYRMFASF
jgi:hypothetical protein